MLSLEIIRQRCEELLSRTKDPVQRKKLLEYRQRLQEDDCYANARKRSRNYDLLLHLGFSVDEAYEYYIHMENATEVRGVLFPKRCGSEYPVKTILNPEIEDYYQFDSGSVFKIRNGIEGYRLRGDGVWERDGSLLRRMFEGDYDRIRYQITQSDAQT